MLDESDAGPRVLLVEDEVDMLLELHDGLNRLGIQSVMTHNAVEALGILESQPDIQVIVTDLMMPRMDGIELLKRITDQRSGQPVAAIVLTGYATLDRALDALRVGAVDFLQKPLNIDDIARAILRAFALVKDGRTSKFSDKLEQSSELDRLNYLKGLIAVRADRETIFQSDLFHDAAWNMLLDLAVAEESGYEISVKSLCIASGVPNTTALRRIDDLEGEDLIFRVPDLKDKRRIIVHLTDHGRKKIEAFVRKSSVHLGVKLV